jgi:hypothetical protein
MTMLMQPPGELAATVRDMIKQTRQVITCPDATRPQALARLRAAWYGHHPALAAMCELLTRLPAPAAVAALRTLQEELSAWLEELKTETGRETSAGTRVAMAAAPGSSLLVEQMLTHMRDFLAMDGPWRDGEKRQAYARFKKAWDQATVPERQQYQDTIQRELMQRHGLEPKKSPRERTPRHE